MKRRRGAGHPAHGRNESSSATTDTTERTKLQDAGFKALGEQIDLLFSSSPERRDRGLRQIRAIVAEFDLPKQIADGVAFAHRAGMLDSIDAIFERTGMTRIEKLP